MDRETSRLHEAGIGSEASETHRRLFRPPEEPLHPLTQRRADPLHVLRAPLKSLRYRVSASVALGRLGELGDGDVKAQVKRLRGIPSGSSASSRIK